MAGRWVVLGFSYWSFSHAGPNAQRVWILGNSAQGGLETEALNPPGGDNDIAWPTSTPIEDRNPRRGCIGATTHFVTAWSISLFPLTIPFPRCYAFHVIDATVPPSSNLAPSYLRARGTLQRTPVTREAPYVGHPVIFLPP